MEERVQLNADEDVLVATLKRIKKLGGVERYSLYLSADLVTDMFRAATKKKERIGFFTNGDDFCMELAESGLKIRQLLNPAANIGEKLEALYGASGDIEKGIRIEIIHRGKGMYTFGGVRDAS